MTAMKTIQLVNDKQKLHAAFKAMRANGVKATLGVPGCCRSCIWHERTQIGTKPWDGVPVVWFYNGQGNQLRYDLDDMITSHSSIYLNHNSYFFPTEVAECARILAEHGLNVSWDGTQDSCIEVIFS